MICYLFFCSLFACSPEKPLNSFALLYHTYPHTLSSIPTWFSACLPLWDKARLMLLPFTILACRISDQKGTQHIHFEKQIYLCQECCTFYMCGCINQREGWCDNVIHLESRQKKKLWILPSLVSNTFTSKPLLAKKQAFSAPTWRVKGNTDNCLKMLPKNTVFYLSYIHNYLPTLLCPYILHSTCPHANTHFQKK